MPNSENTAPVPPLATAVVLRVRDGSCDVLGPDGARTVRFAPPFPTPHTERVSPGNLVAVATDATGRGVVLWRWFDAVLLGVADDGRVTLWEPAHGEVTADPRPGISMPPIGSRVYASAGLPGAEWWVAAAVPSDPGTGTAAADLEAVDLEAVAELYTAHDLWSVALTPPQ